MISYEKLKRWVPPIARQTYDEAYTALYALAHGVGSRPDSASELDFVARPLRLAFPTMPLALANEDRMLEHGGTGIDYSRVVLGEQSITLHRPIPISASVLSRGEVGPIIDKGPGGNAIITLVRRLYEETAPDAPIATMTAAYIALGQGGFGGAREATVDLSPIPDRSPDQTYVLPTLPQLALLFDLTGDYVDFHVNVEAARALGFERPILHGLCTVGLVAYAAMASGAASGAISGLWVRLGAVVYPGETIRFDMWDTPDGVRVRARAVERDQIVIRDAIVRS